jgi:PAS domain S-box-containing protein
MRRTLHINPHAGQRLVTLLAASILLAPALSAMDLFAAPSETVPACATITVDENFSKAQPGPGMCILEDKSGNLTIDAVSSPAMSSSFTRSLDAVPNLGYTKSAVWVKLPVTGARADTGKYYLEIMPPFLDRVELYCPEDRGFKKLALGDNFPFHWRKVYYRNLVFPVSVAAGTHTWYLRFRNDGPLGLDISLWDIDRFHRQKAAEDAILWLIYGMITALILYNIFIFFIIRDLSYLYYVVFMASFLLWAFTYSGSAYQYLWPDSPVINSLAIELSMYCVLVFCIQFFRHYLDTASHFPVSDKILISLMILCVLGIAFTATTMHPYADLIVIIMVLTVIIALISTSIISVARKIPLAWNYLIAWLPILLLGLLNILRALSVVPQTWLTHYGTHFGGAIQGILFSMALSSRINLYRNERLKALDSLQVTEEKYRRLFEIAAEGIFVIQGTRIILGNQSGIHLLGYDSMDEITGTIRDYVHGKDYEAIERFVRDISPDRTKARGRFRIVRKNAEVRWVDGSATMITWEGVPSHLVLLLDITEQKNSEEKLRNSLGEKEVLLKEIHHRVKNNLQVISSLLALSQDQLRDESDRNVFSDSRSRIRTMALIHEKIYQSGDLARIDFSSYLTELASTLVQSHSISAGEVALDIDTRGVILDIDAAIPCGLIINELVTNCLKHAFPGGGRGTISISLSQETVGEERMYRLVVSDNGRGIDVAGKVESPQTLGIQLVKNLTRQMKGTFDMESDSGSRATILFPEKQG